MKLHRRFLYTGLFLAALGGVLVASDTNVVDTASLADAVRLWPLAVIAIGLGIVVRRTRAGIPAGMLAAAIPGLVLGGAITVVPRYVGDCGARGDTVQAATQQGTFDGAARVSITTRCGALTVNTAPGNGWQVAAGNTNGRAPTVNASSQSLSVGTTATGGWELLDGGRDAWSVTLPTADLDSLTLVANANRSTVGLAGARIGRLAITANASNVAVDASAGTIGTLSGVVNLGSLSVLLPAEADLAGSVHVNLGHLQVCTPPGLGFRVATSGPTHDIDVGGQRQGGSFWQSANYTSAAHRADLSVTVSLGTIEINPIGGCR